MTILRWGAQRRKKHRSEDRPRQERPASEGERCKSEKNEKQERQSLTPEGVSYSWPGRGSTEDGFGKIAEDYGGLRIASRRKAEEIIAGGRVTLNGKVITEQGTKADPERI